MIQLEDRVPERLTKWIEISVLEQFSHRPKSPNCSDPVNSRMRTRMSGGVGAGRENLPATRFMWHDSIDSFMMIMAET